MAIDDVFQELVIKLGLDPAPLRKGAEAVAKDLDKLDKGAGKTQGKVKNLSTETSDFGKKGADAFAAVRREALSYFAIVTGGRGLSSFIKDTTKANVSLENMSRQLRVSRQNLLQYRYALQAVGSDGGGYEKLLATIQAMSKDREGFKTLNRLAPQLGVKLLNDDGSVRGDILDQLNGSKTFQNRDRGNQQLLLSKIGGNSDLLNLIDSPRYKSLVNSRNFQGLAPTDEQVKQSQQLLEDWVKFQAETSKIFSRVYSDIQPVADTIVKGLTAIEQSHPRAIASGIEALAAAITVLGTATLGSQLVKLGKLGKAVPGAKKNSGGLLSKAGGLLSLGWIAEKTKSVVINGIEYVFDKSGAWLYESGVKGAVGRAGARFAVGASNSLGAAETVAGNTPYGRLVLGAYGGIKLYDNRENIKAALKPYDVVTSTLTKGGAGFFETAGVLARIFRESGGDPRAVGDNGKAYGLLQWHPDRQKDFKREFGHDIRQSTLEEQAKFIVWELHHTEKAAFRAIQNARSAGEAGAAVSTLYARPADKLGEARKTALLAEQINASLNASSGRNAQTNHFNVSLGDINVTSNAANPAHVANEVNASTSGHLKKTMDEFRKSIVRQNAGGIY